MKEGNKKLIVFLILGLFAHQHQVNSQIIEVISFAWTLFEIFSAVQDATSNEPSNADILEKTAQVSEDLEEWGTKLEAKIQQSVDLLLRRIPLLDKIADDAQALTLYVARINELYDDLMDYVTYPEDYGPVIIGDLIKSFVSRDGDDVQNTISALHSLLVPTGVGKLKDSLLLLLAQEMQDHGLEVCDTGAPPQQRIIDLYNLAMESEKKALTLATFGYMMRGYMMNITTTAVLRRTREKIQLRARQYIDLLKQTMALAPTKFRRCDPPQHERGVTFYEFERFLQRYVVQQGIFQADKMCHYPCYQHEKPEVAHLGCQGIGCKEDAPTSCYGRVANCDGMADYAGVCTVNAPASRRYYWFQGANDVMWGADSPDVCPGKMVYAYEERYYYEENLSTRCEPCQCTCIEDAIEAKSNHFISLREQLTDIENNMVATGVAFVIENQIARIRVMQGKLGPQAEVLRNSTGWAEEEYLEFDWIESSHHKWSTGENKFFFWGRYPGKEWQELKPDEDIAVLTFEDRRIYLDNIDLEQGYVVTGVRFTRNLDEEKKPIQLEVQGTRFDEETFKLDPSSSKWVKPDDMKYAKAKGAERTHLDQEEPKNPLLSGITALASEPYSSIDIEMTSVKLDAGQTVVPLLDGLPVVSNPPYALVGVGLYHRKAPEHGGILTFVLDALERSQYIKLKDDETPEDE